jgi:hypothetical protein
MGKWLALTALAAAVGVAPAAALAQHNGGGHGGGSHGGGHGGGGWHGGGHGGGSWRGGGHGGGDWHGGGRWHGGGWHGGHHRGGFSVFLGPSFYWGPAYYPWYDTPAYYGPTYYYDPAPAYVAPAPAAPVGTYRYYCPTGGYWPEHRSCPQGWLRVLPN